MVSRPRSAMLRAVSGQQILWKVCLAARGRPFARAISGVSMDIVYANQFGL